MILDGAPSRSEWPIRPIIGLLRNNDLETHLSKLKIVNGETPAVAWIKNATNMKVFICKNYFSEVTFLKVIFGLIYFVGLIFFYLWT